MATRARRLAAALLRPPLPDHHLLTPRRLKTTSAQYVAARARDPTFEKLMDGYKHLLKVTAVVDLILASPLHALPLPFLSSLAQKLRLNRGAPHFVRRYPHVFSLSYDAAKAQALVGLTPAAAEVCRGESLAAAAGAPAAVDRLTRLLSMSPSRTLPLRAVFKVWRELGLPDDFEDSVISGNPIFFSVRNNPREPNTHLLQLVAGSTGGNPSFTPAVEKWRKQELLKKKDNSEEEKAEIRFGFEQGFPPGMRLSKGFRAKVKEWQRLPYVGPYDRMDATAGVSKAARRGQEKRAVGVVHEFLDLTVEKMVEVEKISHFRKWFGIDLNVRDLFLDHPGIFYLSTKGKRHTVFLREGYDRGRLIDPNPVYDARRKLLDLVLLGKRGLDAPVEGGCDRSGEEEVCSSDV